MEFSNALCKYLQKMPDIVRNNENLEYIQALEEVERVRKLFQEKMREYTEECKNAGILRRLCMEVLGPPVDFGSYPSFPAPPNLKKNHGDLAHKQWIKILSSTDVTGDLFRIVDKNFDAVERDIASLERGLQEFKELGTWEQLTYVDTTILTEKKKALGVYYPDCGGWDEEDPGLVKNLIVSLRRSGGALFNLLEGHTKRFHILEEGTKYTYRADTLALREKLSLVIEKKGNRPLERCLTEPQFASALQDFYREQYGKRIEKLLAQAEKTYLYIKNREKQERDRTLRIR